MRYVDILDLALSALVQQKVRTTLTSLGVVFATFILVASLSVRQGVKETIVEQYAKFSELRRVEVYPRARPDSREKEIPPDKLEVKGVMSEAKRQRIRQQIVNRWRYVGRPEIETRLTEDVVKALASLDHVRAIDPVLMHPAWASLSDKTEQVSTVAALPEHEQLRTRLLAGATFASPMSRQVIVTEYLLYQFGVVNDSDVEQVLGQKLRLEYRFQERSLDPGYLVSVLTGASKSVKRDDSNALDKVLAQLPAALDKFDLSKEEKSSLRALLTRDPAAPETRQVVFGEEFTICGVLRSPGKEDRNDRWDWWLNNSDVVVPAKTAEDLFFRVPRHQESGLDRVLVEVDHMDHVKDVAARIKGMGLSTSTMLERIEMEQFTYNLIFSSMTVFAAIGLLVAALGITNTMLMSVLERVREIGIMKAVGGRDLHIQTIFLLEGALVGLVGGLLGLLLGWAASYPGDAWVRSVVSSNLSIKLESSIFRFPPWLQVAAPAFACLMTTLAAYYPARRAARVNPITALRHE